jgi:hypothetical protein
MTACSNSAGGGGGDTYSFAFYATDSNFFNGSEMFGTDQAPSDGTVKYFSSGDKNALIQKVTLGYNATGNVTTQWAASQSASYAKLESEFQLMANNNPTITNAKTTCFNKLNEDGFVVFTYGTSNSKVWVFGAFKN